MNGDVREVEEETVGLSYSVEGGGGSHFLPSAGPANWGPPWEVAGLQGSHQPMRYHCGDKKKQKRRGLPKKQLTTPFKPDYIFF